GFMHAYAWPDHERRAAEILSAELPADVTICLSSEVCPEIREYERFSTTCANAYVRPMMQGYLLRLRAELDALGMTCPLLLMMSGGGRTTLELSSPHPVLTRRAPPPPARPPPRSRPHARSSACCPSTWAARPRRSASSPRGSPSGPARS